MTIAIIMMIMITIVVLIVLRTADCGLPGTVVVTRSCRLVKVVCCTVSSRIDRMVVSGYAQQSTQYLFTLQRQLQVKLGDGGKEEVQLARGRKSKSRSDLCRTRLCLLATQAAMVMEDTLIAKVVPWP